MYGFLFFHFIIDILFIYVIESLISQLWLADISRPTFTSNSLILVVQTFHSGVHTHCIRIQTHTYMR